MMPRQWRMAKEQDFARVYQRGKRRRLPSFNVWYLLVGPSQASQVGLVVSGKVSSKATERNRIRRRIWAALRENKQLMPSRGVHLIIAARAQGRQPTYQEVLQDIRQLLKAF